MPVYIKVMQITFGIIVTGIICWLFYKLYKGGNNDK